MSAAKRLLIHIYDENGDKMFALYDNEGGVSHSQSIAPDQSRAATLFQKLEGEIKKETECIPRTTQTSLSISRSISTEFELLEATGEKTTNITEITAELESIPHTYVKAETAFSAVGLFITRLRSRLSDKSVNFSVFYVHISSQSG